MNLIPDSPEYDIRYSKIEDLEYLKQWVSHPESVKWYPVSSEKDIDDMTKNWIGFSRVGASLTADYKGKPVGIATLFLMPYRKLIHHCLIYFVVDPEHKGQGVGTSIVKNATHLAKTYFRFEKVHLETYEGSPSLSLLKKVGYREIVRQDHFVKLEDGSYLARVIMEVELEGFTNG